MIKKSKYIVVMFFTFTLFLTIELMYINNTKSMSSKALTNKLDFLKLTRLPDLAISTEANYIRHRSISDIYSIYKDDGSLREYFPSTYVISHSHIKADSI